MEQLKNESETELQNQSEIEMQNQSEAEMRDEKYMKEALKQAKKAYALEETPIGCVIVHEGKIIARGYNRRNTDKSPLAHSAIRNVIASSNTRRSSPVLFCSLSRRYTSVFLWINSCLDVSETFRLFSKNLLIVTSVSSSKSSGLLSPKISRINILQSGMGS